MAYIRFDRWVLLGSGFLAAPEKRSEHPSVSEGPAAGESWEGVREVGGTWLPPLSWGTM